MGCVLDCKPVKGRRFAIGLIVAICVGGPIVEMFDQWDHTVQDGKDTEADAVIAALCVGIGISLAGVAVQCVRALASQSQRISIAKSPPVRLGSSCVIDCSNPGDSPPLPLRV
jgi:hypothetical protein